MYWKQAPLIRIIIPLISGIALAVAFDFYNLHLSLLLTVFFFLTFSISHFFFRKLKYTLRWLPGLLLSVSFFLAGITLTNINREDAAPGFFTAKAEEGDKLLLWITKPPEEKNKTFKAIAEVKAVIKEEKLTPASGNVLVYFRKDSLSRQLSYGDEILISAMPQPIPPPKNPEEFDFRRYMALKNVYHNIFLDETGWIKFSEAPKPFWQFLFNLRAEWGDFFEENIEGTSEQAIAKALVLGDVSELSPQLRSAYAGTGTMHILAVSGLHVGFIFLALNFFTRSMQNRLYTKILRLIILLFVLWSYALLTGLSPSVFRAVTMFSFVAIGQNIRRITNTYNSLAFAALAILLYDPFLIANVGFQLSFAAVLGIIWLQPKTSNLWQPENKIVKRIWQLTAVSVAAQFATFPLGLFYFNQFPSYFIFSNLFAIPVAMLVLGAGYIFIILRLIQFTFLYELLGKILYWLIFSLNYVVNKFKALPYAQLDGVFISTLECMLLYILLISILFAFIHKHKTWLKFSLGFLIVFLTFRLFAFYESYKTPQFVVHSVQGNLLMSIKDKNSLHLIGDSAFINHPDKTDFLISRYAYKNFISKSNISKFAIENPAELNENNLFVNQNSGQFRDKKWLVLNKNIDVKNLDADIGLDLDYLIVDGNPKLKIKELAEKLRFKKLIITKNNSRYSAEKWVNECKELNIDCFNIQKENSFVVN